MKEEQTYDINVEGEVVTYVQKSVRTMNMAEALQQHGAFCAELQAIKGKQAQIKQQIESKIMEKQLESINTSLTDLEKIDESWKAIVQPEIDKIVKELRAEVKVEKAKRGYNRVSDRNAKIVLQNSILAPIVNAKNLDMAHPGVLLVKKDFDKI